MKPVLLGCLVLVMVTGVRAHRLDECLQAALVSVATNHIDVALELTPGAVVADQIWAMIDTNRDGLLTDHERAAYVQRLLQDIRIGIDDKPLVLRVVETSFPGRLDIRSGLGVIRINLSAAIGPLAAGRHFLNLTNAHVPAISVYLVNALVPDDRAIKITKQTRDELQKRYRLDFVVSATPRSRTGNPSPIASQPD